MFSSFMNTLAIALSLSTAGGLFLHDMHIDMAASAALAMPAAPVNYDTNNNKLMNFSNDAHTHVERNAFSQLIDRQGQNPRVQPRATEDKKHLLQKQVGRGHHPFDNYHLPLV
jgi:hypothetical protein